MIPKHTPGPWKVMPEEAHRDYIRIRGTQLGCIYKIANVHVACGGGSAVQKEVDECRANARLIAAAPELLEACRALRSASDAGDFTAAVTRCSELAARLDEGGAR